MADISKVKVTQNGSSAEYIVKDATARAAIANITSDLANYYLKTETYSKGEVDNLIAGIKQFTYVVADSLPTPSASTMYKIYLIPSAHSVTSNVRDEYITIQDGSTYKFEQIGSTAADFSAYSTTEEMNAAIATALEDYYSKDEVDENYVSATHVQTFTDTEKEQARTNIGAGKASDVDAANVNVEGIEEQLLDAENSVDFDEIPLMGGQPMILFGEGTPQNSIVPRNWKQFLDGGYDWNGTPSIEGQVYIDTTAETNGRYTAVKSGNTLVWLNF